MLELYDIIRRGYVSQISSVVDDVTGKRPITQSICKRLFSSFHI